MNNTGDGLVWADQRTAEKVGEARYAKYVDLLDELAALAEQTNSLALDRLVQSRRQSLLVDMHPALDTSPA